MCQCGGVRHYNQDGWWLSSPPLPLVTTATPARDSDQFSQKSTQNFPLTRKTQGVKARYVLTFLRRDS